MTLYRETNGNHYVYFIINFIVVGARGCGCSLNFFSHFLSSSSIFRGTLFGAAVFATLRIGNRRRLCLYQHKNFIRNVFHLIDFFPFLLSLIMAFMSFPFFFDLLMLFSIHNATHIMTSATYIVKTFSEFSLCFCQTKSFMETSVNHSFGRSAGKKSSKNYHLSSYATKVYMRRICVHTMYNRDTTCLYLKTWQRMQNAGIMSAEQ